MKEPVFNAGSRTPNDVAKLPTITIITARNRSQEQPQLLPRIVHTTQGGGGYSDFQIFTYIRRLGSIFWVQILNFIIFGGFQKNKYFMGMKIMWEVFRVITKLDYTKVSFLCILGSFLKVKV